MWALQLQSLVRKLRKATAIELRTKVQDTFLKEESQAN